MTDLLQHYPLARPVRLKVSLLKKSAPVTTDNFYSLSIFHPSYENPGDRAIRKTHIFTENELVHANTRYFVECPVMDEKHTEIVLSYRQAVMGYLGVITYTNKNGVLTTRFVVRLNFNHVEGPDGGRPDVVCLFTAREIKRSLERCDWLKLPWTRRLRSWLWRIWISLF